MKYCIEIGLSPREYNNLVILMRAIKLGLFLVTFQAKMPHCVYISLSGMCDSWIKDVVDLELYMYMHVTVGHDQNIYIQHSTNY